VKLTYSDYTNYVKTELGRSEWFETSTGVKHGNVLLPIMFNAMLDKIVNKVRGENRGPDMKTVKYAAEDALICRKDEMKLKRN
jgi:hypothetical protein